MGANGGRRATEHGGYFGGGNLFDIAEDEGGALAHAEGIEALVEISGLFGAEQSGVGAAVQRVGERFSEGVNLGEVDAGAAAEEINRGIAGDAAEPLGGFFGVLQLVFALEGLDEGVLGEVLRVGDITDNAVDQSEDTTKILTDKAILQLALGCFGPGTGSGSCRHGGHYQRYRRKGHLSLPDAREGGSVQRQKRRLRLNYMKRVHIAGVGKTAFGVLSGRGLRELAGEAMEAAIGAAGRDRREIEAVYVGNFDAPSFTGQNHLGPLVAGAAGLEGVPATRFEAACASGGSALFHAVQAVRAGLYRNVLVCGVEKMTGQTTARVAEILAGAGDADSEARLGATFPAIFALIARRHMHQYGTTREQLAAVAVKNHWNASMNPQAHLRKVISIEQALAGKPVADPLTLYDCSPVSDGAAAVWVTSEPGEVEVVACAQASGALALADKREITTFEATRRAARRAYEEAGMEPGEIQLAEVHDCFTIAELIAMEDLGFIEAGESGAWVESGATGIDGSLPVNTSGGLKAKGHPIGATGVGQICDLVQQLRGQAGERQVSRRDVGLTQNLGGSGATSVVTILRRTV